MEEKQKNEKAKQPVEKAPKVEKTEKKEKEAKFERVDKPEKVETKVEAKKKEEKPGKEKKAKKKSKVGTAIKTILLAILLLLAIYIICTFFQWSLLCSIYDSNTEFDAGNNYKVTIQYGGETQSTTVKLYKDGVGIYQLGNAGYIRVDDQSAYIILKDLKQYMKLDKDSSAAEVSSVGSVATYEVFENTNKTKLLQDVLFGKIQIQKQEYNGQECYFIFTDTEKVWADKDTKLIIRDEIEGEYKEIKIEQNVVTDQDIALPDLSGYINLQ